MLNPDVLENLSEAPSSVLVTRRIRAGIETNNDPELVFNRLRFDPAFPLSAPVIGVVLAFNRNVLPGRE